MAKILTKNTRRCRIQFSLPPELFDENKRINALADELAVVIDYSRDFERWLRVQLEQVNAELIRIRQERADMAIKKIPTATATIVRESAPTTDSIMTVESMEG